MKKFLILSLIMFAGLFASAQQASKIHTYSCDEGKFVNFNVNSRDTLKSNDTITFVFNVAHQHEVNAIIDLYSAVNTSDTSVAITFYESMDGTNYVVMNYGASPGAYTKTLAKGTTHIEYNGASDIAWFESRYFKIMCISKTKSGCRKVLKGAIKFNIR